MKILISGKKGKLYDAVARAFPARRDFRAEVVPPGLRLLEMAQSGSYAAVIFVLENEQDLEPLRWLVQSNPALPVVAVLSGGSPKLRKRLQREGVSRVIETGNLPALAVWRLLRARLAELPPKSLALQDAAVPITTDLHGIRSALTAIQGYAELALAKVRAPSPRRKPLEEIVQGVTEVEGLLRRIERKLRPSRTSPQK